ncbi:MAG: hypothetical protein PVF65_01230 [Sphingomonadales bacterium]|jgi:hypothetical protein
MSAGGAKSALADIARLGWHGFKAERGNQAYKALIDIGAYFDAMTAEGAQDISLDDSARDRLFDVLMMRFDQLQAHRSAVQSIAKSAPSDPKMLRALVCALPKSMRVMLRLAHIRADGVEGRLKAQVLSLLWLRVARHWMRDGSEDMAETMATLDKELAQIEPVGRRLFPHDETMGDESQS